MPFEKKVVGSDIYFYFLLWVFVNAWYLSNNSKESLDNIIYQKLYFMYLKFVGVTFFLFSILIGT